MSNIPRQLHVPRDAEFLLYPEKSLYDLDTPPENLLPSRALENVSESEETIQEYRREAEETCRNPISYFLGPAPIVIHLNQVEFDKGDDFPAYREPEPLPKVNGNNMNFLEQITAESGEYTRIQRYLFVVELDSAIFLLKAFVDDSDYQDGSETGSIDSEEDHVGIYAFRREQRAYAHLRHYGVAAGSVPACPGWVTLSQEQMEYLAADPRFKCWPYVPDDFTVFGILLEYFPNATSLSVSNITLALAESAMRGLCKIHGCYVLHDDHLVRNCLVVSENRVVWVDFDESRTLGIPRKSEADPPLLTRLDFWQEASEVWTKLYHAMLPDKRIGRYSESGIY